MFEARQLPASPLYILLHSWATGPRDRRFFFDVLVNIAVYMPLGVSAYLVMRRFRSRVLTIVGPIVVGALLSAAIEMIQLYTPHRVCSAVDLASNTLGSAFGLLAGFAFTQITEVPAEGREFRFRDRNAVALLFCWVAFLVFPLYPDLSLEAWRVKIFAFINASFTSPIPALSNAAEWFAVGRLLVAAGVSSPFQWLLFFLLLVPVQLGIVNHSPMPADFIGAGLGALLFLFFGRGPRADRRAGIALLLTVTLVGLSPFYFAGPTRPFSWTPFVGVLNSDSQNATSLLLGKLFRYGGSIWLLRRARVGIVPATAIVTVVLAAIEVLQMWIPGHVPEITDPLLALLLFAGLLALGPAARDLPAATHPKAQRQRSRQH